MPESMGILHPGTSFGVFWSTNVARNWYRNEKYPLIPEKPGIRRGIPRQEDSPYLPARFWNPAINSTTDHQLLVSLP